MSKVVMKSSGFNFVAVSIWDRSAGCVQRNRRISVIAIVRKRGRPMKARPAKYEKRHMTVASAANQASGRLNNQSGEALKSRNIETMEKTTSGFGSQPVAR